MGEIVEAHDEGRLIEAFGCGTAAVVSPIESIGFKGKVSIYLFISFSLYSFYYYYYYSPLFFIHNYFFHLRRRFRSRWGTAARPATSRSTSPTPSPPSNTDKSRTTGLSSSTESPFGICAPNTTTGPHVHTMLGSGSPPKPSFGLVLRLRGYTLLFYMIHTCGSPHLL
jgi:hypothetical protein